MLQIRQATRAEFAPIAALMDRTNENPARQCLHSGEGAEAIQKQMEIWDEGNEFCIVGAWDDDELVGAFGCEYDEELGRGWLWGPFAADEETADALFSHLLTVLPTTITLIQSYLNVDNQWGDAFYRRHGFGQAKVSHVYIAPRPEELCQPDELLPEVTADQAASFAQLHDITFPNTFYSSQDILGMLNETNKVFVWAKDDEALGYLYAKVDESTGEGYVEFVGVAEQAQRQGIGRKLLATAVYWLFHDQQVPQIALNVNDDNNNARNLYESTGFHLEYAGVALKRAR